MKKLFLFGVLLCMSVGLFAQDRPKNELAISWGVATTPQLVDVFTTALSGGLVDYSSSTQAISAQYLRNLNNTWAVGAAAICEAMEADDANSDGKQNLISVMPVARAHWFDKKHFGMYSKAGVGVCLWNEKLNGQSTNDVTVAYQVSPVCMEAGSESVRGFMELGFGFQGIVNLGVRFGF